MPVRRPGENRGGIEKRFCLLIFPGFLAAPCLSGRTKKENREISFHGNDKKA